MGAQFYREHLAAGGVDGVPIGSLYAANLLTDAGVQGSAKRYQARQAFDEGRAAYAVNLMLAHNAGKTFKKQNNPYSQALASSYASVPGLGDAGDGTTVAVSEDEIAEAYGGNPTVNPVTTQALMSLTPTVYSSPVLSVAAPSAGGSSSGWQNVLNSSATANLFSGIGSGLSRLIGGSSAVATPLLGPQPSGPSFTTMLVVGGGLGLALLLLLRRKKTA